MLLTCVIHQLKAFVEEILGTKDIHVFLFFE